MRDRDMENVIVQSPVNGGVYAGDELPEQHILWPRCTWFQQRRMLLQLKKEQEQLINPKEDR